MKITNEIVDERISGRPIIRIGDFKGTKKKLEWKCLHCNNIWLAIPNAVFRGTGCPTCAKNQKLTNKEFDERIKNRPIKRVGEYKGHDYNIKMKCLNDGCDNVWTTKATYVLSSESNCPKCYGTMIYTNEEIDQKIEDRPLNRVGDYGGAHQNILWECTVCEHLWEASPNRILQGQGCPECNINSKRLSNELIDSRIASESFIRVGDYIDSSTKIEWKCKVCKETWESTPNNILTGRKCPTCTLNQKDSRLATHLKKLAAKMFKIHAIEYRKFINPLTGRYLPFDIFVQEGNKKYIIEVHGRQHYEFVEWFHNDLETFAYRKKIDSMKKEWAISNGYIFIEIPYNMSLENAENILRKIKNKKSDRSA